VRKLHLVGLTADRKGLIFTARKGSQTGGYVVPLEDDFLDAIAEAQRRRNGTRVSTRRTEEPSQSHGPRRSNLTPREIQARLRAGRSPEAVADEADVDVEWVERFAVPILAEQAQVAELARTLVYTKPKVGDSDAPLDESVTWNLLDRGVTVLKDEFNASWGAHQLHDQVWAVRFQYRGKGRAQMAEWEVDVRSGELRARNRLGAELAYVERDRPPPAVPAQKTAASGGAAGEPVAETPPADVSEEVEAVDEAVVGVAEPAEIGAGAVDDVGENEDGGAMAASAEPAPEPEPPEPEPVKAAKRTRAAKAVADAPPAADPPDADPRAAAAPGATPPGASPPGEGDAADSTASGATEGGADEGGADAGGATASGPTAGATEAGATEAGATDAGGANAGRANAGRANAGRARSAAATGAKPPGRALSRTGRRPWYAADPGPPLPEPARPPAKNRTDRKAGRPATATVKPAAARKTSAKAVTTSVTAAKAPSPAPDAPEAPPEHTPGGAGVRMAVAKVTTARVAASRALVARAVTSQPPVQPPPPAASRPRVGYAASATPSSRHQAQPATADHEPSRLPVRRPPPPAHVSPPAERQPGPRSEPVRIPAGPPGANPEATGRFPSVPADPQPQVGPPPIVNVDVETEDEDYPPPAPPSQFSPRPAPPGPVRVNSRSESFDDVDDADWGDAGSTGYEPRPRISAPPAGDWRPLAEPPKRKTSRGAPAAPPTGIDEPRSRRRKRRLRPG
jgi:hypothetical protein